MGKILLPIRSKTKAFKRVLSMSKWIEQGIHALLHRGLHEVIHYAAHELPKVIDEIGKTSNKLFSSNTDNPDDWEQEFGRQLLEDMRRDEEFEQLLDREQSERLILLHEIRRLTQPYSYHPDFDYPRDKLSFEVMNGYGTYRQYFAGATVEALKKVLRLKEEEREARLKKEREARLKAVIIFTSCFSVLILAVGGSLIYNNFVSNIETTSSQTETGAK